MDARQLTIWPEMPALLGKRRGEASSGPGAKVEVSITPAVSEIPAKSSQQIMERIASHENLMKALKRVVGNKGAPGCDGMTVRDLKKWYDGNIEALREKLLRGQYVPEPVRARDIPKSSGGTRQLGIPNVRDRLVQQAVAQILQEMFDPSFSDNSYGFRPGRSAHQAIEQARRHITDGNQWVVDLDIEKFFDRVNHDRLMSVLSVKVSDGRVLKLVRGFLTAGIMRDGLVSPMNEGTPQGGPLSPLLSNIVLDELDRELERRGHKFVRYADDCNIFVRSRRSGARVMDCISRFIGCRLRLKVNKEKSAVAEASKVQYLGFSFWKRKGEILLRVARKSLDRLKYRVRALTKRKRMMNIGDIIRGLSNYLRGWKGYFGICLTKRSFEDIDSWIRRRLRCLIWTQWKRGKNRYAELRRLDVSHELAAMGAGSRKGPWRMSRNQAVHMAFSTTWFDGAGLIRLSCVN